MLRRIILATMLVLFASASNATFEEDLAWHHAPIHYQDTDSTRYHGDYVTAIDYDSDWVSTNNWDNFQNGQWPATVYYSVVESCSHYFVTYAFYHAQDWTDSPFDGEHENDLEGALFVIRKDGSEYGTLDGMITVFHSDFYSYRRPNSGLVNGHEDIDGDIHFTHYEGSNRARTAQEAKGHGLKAWPQIANFTGASDQDGIIYYPTRGNAEYPSSGNDRNVKYRLVDITENNGLWDQALSSAWGANETFHTWGTFSGDTSGGCGGAWWKHCTSNSANTPWGWNDGDDGDSHRGEFALDPSRLTGHYFNGLGVFNGNYLKNKYLEDLQTSGFSSGYTPYGFPDELDLNSLYGRLTDSCQ